LHWLLAIAEQRDKRQELAEAEESIKGLVAATVNPGRSNNDPFETAAFEVLLGFVLVAEPVMRRIWRRADSADVDEPLDPRGDRSIDLIARGRR
jgi:hypothetical protein